MCDQTYGCSKCFLFNLYNFMRFNFTFVCRQLSHIPTSYVRSMVNRLNYIHWHSLLLLHGTSHHDTAVIRCRHHRTSTNDWFEFRHSEQKQRCVYFRCSLGSSTTPHGLRSNLIESLSHCEAPHGFATLIYKAQRKWDCDAT